MPVQGLEESSHGAMSRRLPRCAAGQNWPVGRRLDMGSAKPSIVELGLHRGSSERYFAGMVDMRELCRLYGRAGLATTAHLHPLVPALDSSSVMEL
jgi:hypothetical protein